MTDPLDELAEYLRERAARTAPMIEWQRWLAALEQERTDARRLPREPTEAMIAAGRVVQARLNQDAAFHPAMSNASAIWEAMYDAAIDAALAKDKTP